MTVWTWTEAFSVSKTQLAVAAPPGTARIQGECLMSKLSCATIILTLCSVEDDTTNDSHGVILFPPPTEDPRDPLNLPAWHKVVALVVVSIYTFVANFTSSIIAPALQIWPMSFPQDPKSVPQLTYLIAVSLVQRAAQQLSTES